MSKYVEDFWFPVLFVRSLKSPLHPKNKYKAEKTKKQQLF